MLIDLLVRLSAAMKTEGLIVAPDGLSDAARYILASPSLSPDDNLPDSLQPILVKRAEDEAAYSRAWRRLFQEDRPGQKLSWYHLLQGTENRSPSPPATPTHDGPSWAPWQCYEEYRRGQSKDRFERAVMEALAREQEIDSWEEAFSRELHKRFLANDPATELDRLVEEASAFRKEFSRLKRQWNRVMAVAPVEAAPVKIGEKHALRPEFTQGFRANLQRWGNAELFMRPMEDIGEKELRELDEPIREMAERLRLRLEGRRVKIHGKVDMRKTIRLSQKTFGEPMKIVYVWPKRRRARWVVLADVSGSVKYASKLLMSFLWQLRNVVDEDLRGFIFVSKVKEVTAILRETQYERAMKRIANEVGVDFRGYSDYGVAFQAFDGVAEEALDSQSILLILGDARNNQRNPRLEFLQKWCVRARKILWFNPEIPEKWNEGDSVIDLYAQVVRDIYDVSTPAKLIEAVERVVI